MERNLDALDYARLMHARSGVKYSKLLEDADLPAGGFDFITLVEVLEHLGQEEGSALLGRLGRLLSPEGRLVLTTPLRMPEAPPNPYHLNEFDTPEDLDAFLSKHFGDVHLESISMGIPNMLAVCREPKL